MFYLSFAVTQDLLDYWLTKDKKMWNSTSSNKSSEWNDRTGLVEVTFKDGTKRAVEADSFGHAASLVQCGSGHIAGFRWLTSYADS